MSKKELGENRRFSYFFLVENNIIPLITGITIIIIAVMRAFSCCSGVGNHSNEPVNKYKSPNKKIIQIIIHKNIRIALILPPPWVYYSIKAVKGARVSEIFGLRRM